MPNNKPTQLQGITDLTVIADIKSGLIEGIFESRSYAWRLHRVLELLDSARHTRREADEAPTPFIDGVARLQGVHFFRFAILPPGDKLLLNVTFDGSWEQYIRLIWGPLGKMLDLIFCHCKDYPLAAECSFDEYFRWVRDHEVPSQFFYADSGGTVADRAYLDRLEAQQRAGGGRPDTDLRAAQLALESPRPPQPSAATVMSALRILRVLHSMKPLFGMPTDGSVLLRFAQDFLPDLRNWIADGLFDPGQQFDTLRAPFESERAWLMSPRWRASEKRDILRVDKKLLQAGILDSLKQPRGRYARGALVFVRVNDDAAARDWLKNASSNDSAARLISDGNTSELTPESVVCTVAITRSGLQALGVHEDYLNMLPAEFVQGMEARAGILGDLRINHPQQWNRPRALNGNAGLPSVPIDLEMVHVAIQLRACETDEEQQLDRSTLLPRLEKWIKDYVVPSRAFELLSIESTWSRPAAEGEPASRDHFGYADGISQPTLTPQLGSMFWDDAVKVGELLLGFVNDRGDGPVVMAGGKPVPTSPPWLDNGTFLVIRKIRQYVERFDAVIEKTVGALVPSGSKPETEAVRELVRSKLMGRHTGGSPLVARGSGVNDFDFRNDADGAQCPFASHVRRANPRAIMVGGRPPRIVRRGMSYGHDGRDEKERGVMFMAYNASIAEQFEVIQRWLTGGNSSGVSSSQPDPLLGVPRIGEPAMYRFVHGDQVVRVDLGDQAICKVEWGLYAFVPSMKLLQTLSEFVDRPRPSEKLPPRDPPLLEPAKEVRQVKAEFEDERGRAERWKQLRDNHAGVKRIGRTLVIGTLDAVTTVLKDYGESYSVSGYGKRMEQTLGTSPFGQDEVGPMKGHELKYVGEVKDAIAKAVTEPQAYETAFKFVEKSLEARLANAKAMGLPTASIDVIELGRDLVAELCKEWFGVVYGDGVAESGGIDPAADRVRCPGHFLVMARNVFSAYPNETVAKLAAKQAQPLKDAVEKWVANVPAAPTAAPVMKSMLDAMALTNDVSKAMKNGTVANVMLGLPATLLGTWVKVLQRWIAGRELRRLQHHLVGSGLSGHQVDRQVLYAPLIMTMAADPVADGIWRTAAKSGELNGKPVNEEDVIWLGIGSALAHGRAGVSADDKAKLQLAEDMLFGGTWRSTGPRDTPHACPGRGLAIGALLGALAATLRAGQWAATPNPTALTLSPFRS